VVVDDDGIGKSGPVEIAINLGRYNRLAAQVGNADDFERNKWRKYFAIAPFSYLGNPAEFPMVVVHHGVLSEECHERGGIMVID
jgi:hypothetical protein